MKNFFIASLPRSRTAWLATYFSMLDGVHCYHEGLKGCNSVDQYIARMVHDIPNAKVGNSDSVLPLTNFQELFPDAPTVVIEREITEVLWSLKENKIPINGYAGNLLAMTQVRLPSIEGLHVAYDDIDARLSEMCDYIGVTYDSRKHTMLRKMNIQTMDHSPDPRGLAVWL